MRSTAAAAAPYADQGHDAVRRTFELAWFERVIGDGSVARLAAGRLSRCVGVDFARPLDDGIGSDYWKWPQLWETAPGRARTVPYSLATEVLVHPWAPVELFGFFTEAGVEPLRAVDRTLQAGPKTQDYWPGLVS
jgi:hypothetical protein